MASTNFKFQKFKIEQFNTVLFCSDQRNWIRTSKEDEEDKQMLFFNFYSKLSTTMNYQTDSSDIKFDNVFFFDVVR